MLHTVTPGEAAKSAMPIYMISLFMMSDLDKLVGCRVSPYMSNLHIWAGEAAKSPMPIYGVLH